jgi:hypothetical protein
LTETGRLAVGVLAEEVVEEGVTEVELAAELEAGAHDWTTSVTVTVGTTVPETVSVTVGGGPAEAVSVAVDVYSVMLYGCQFEGCIEYDQENPRRGRGWHS